GPGSLPDLTWPRTPTGDDPLRAPDGVHRRLGGPRRPVVVPRPARHGDGPDQRDPVRPDRVGAAAAAPGDPARRDVRFVVPRLVLHRHHPENRRLRVTRRSISAFAGVRRYDGPSWT